MSDLSAQESNEPDDTSSEVKVEPEGSSVGELGENTSEPEASGAPGSPEPEGAVEDDQEDIPEEIRYEVAVGGTSQGIATNNALRALSRAARSFLLYEPRNQAIRDFLQEYRENMNATLRAHGPMELDIRPFEMTRDGEIVYLERDRERSLAFRLFRDGVRRISLQPDVAWEELLRLLEILSIRYTGIRQSEDDIVTLLWKAGFKHIGIVAVEGFVPDEERPEGDLLAGDQPKKKRKKRRSGTAHIDAPPDFDLPLPLFEEQAALVWRDIPEERLVELAQEPDSRHLPILTVQLVSHMLAVAADITDPTDLDDVLPLVNEVRDFLLSEGQLEHLTDLVRVVEKHRSIDEERMDPQLAKFADSRALRRILQSVGKASEVVPPELIELLEMVPSEHLDHLMDLLVEERSAASRRLTRMLIERFVKETWDPSSVFERMHREASGVQCDILRATSRALPERVLEEAIQLRDRPSLDVQMEVLWVLERATDEAIVEETMLSMLSSSFTEVRIRVLDFLSDYGTEKVFGATQGMVEHHSTRGITDRECEAAGRVLAVVAPDKAKSVLMGWIKPPGMFKRWVEMPGAQALQRTALYGLIAIPGKEVDEVIRWLSERCGESIYQLCMKTLVHRRKEGVTSGG
jgi:hypothetical protein